MFDFETPVEEVFKKNVKTEKVDDLSGYIKMTVDKHTCNFCGKRTGFNLDRGTIRKDNGFGYNQVVESACCEKMRKTLEGCREMHEKAYLRYFMGQVEERSTPPIYRGLMLGDLKKHEHQKKAYDAIKEYFKKDLLKGFYIHSEKNGTGKTATACIIAKMICAYNGWFSFKFMNYADFVSKYEQLPFEEKGYIIDDYKTCNLLVIDDLGKGRITPAAISNIYSIVNYRGNNRALTICTSNLSLPNVSKTFDSSVASRLFEMTEIIDINGKDLRLN